MSHCLSEYTLVMLYIGEDTEEERTHLVDCGDCSRRYQRLVYDWQRIERILHAGPPPHPAARSLPSPTYRWVPVATAIATIIILAVAGSRWWQPEAPVVANVTSSDEMAQLVETTVVPALFADETLSSVGLPTPVSDETYVRAALGGEWPCEQDESTSSLNCGIHTFPLLIGG